MEQRRPAPLFTYTLLDAEVQTPVLDHVDAVILVPRPEQAFALLQLDEHHVATQLQEQGLLEVTQDPAAEVARSGGAGVPQPPALLTAYGHGSRL